MFDTKRVRRASHSAVIARVLRFGATACLAWTAATAALPAQDRVSGSVSETIDVVEIQLEVQVTGKGNRPVEGLTAADFEVRIGGQPAEVVAVDRIDAKSSRSSRSSRGSADPRASKAKIDRGLTLVVFIDQLHISPGASWRIMAELATFLKSTLKKGDHVMVATYNGAVSVPLPLTNDLDDVIEGLLDVGNAQAWRPTVNEEPRVMRQIQELQEMNMQGARAQPCVNLEPLAIGYATATHSETLSTIAALEYFVDTLAGLPGRKAVLHVSDGLPLIPGRGPYEYIIEMCGGFEGAARGVENAYDYGTDIYDHTDINKMRLDMMRYDTSEQWYQLAARANRNNVTFYPLQVGGLRDPTFGGVATQTRGASVVVDVGRGQNRQDALVLLAGETGGKALINRNQMADGLEQIGKELRDYYLLSVRGVGGAAGDVRKITVDVDRPGLEVRNRRSMRLQSRHQQVADRVLTTAVHVASDNPMGLSARVGSETPASDGQRNVRLMLRIPLSALTLLPTATDQPAQGLFTVFVAASDVEGGVTPVRTATVPVEVRPGDEDDASYTYEVDMLIREGKHVVGFGVFDEIGGEASYLRALIKG